MTDGGHYWTQMGMGNEENLEPGRPVGYASLMMNFMAIVVNGKR